MGAFEELMSFTSPQGAEPLSAQRVKRIRRDIEATEEKQSSVLESLPVQTAKEFAAGFVQPFIDVGVGALRFGEGVTRGAVRGAIELPAYVAEIANINYKDSSLGQMDELWRRYSEIKTGSTIPVQETMAAGFANYIRNKAAEVVPVSMEYAGKNLFDNPELLLDPAWMGEQLGSTAASIAPPLIAFALTKNPMVAGAVGGMMEGSNTYNETYQKAIEQGVPESEAVKKATANFYAMTAGSGMLNAISLNQFTKAGGFGARFLSGATEAGTEWLESPLDSLLQVAAGTMTTEEAIERAKQETSVLPASFILGAGLGAGTAITENQVNYINDITEASNLLHSKAMETVNNTPDMDEGNALAFVDEYLPKMQDMADKNRMNVLDYTRLALGVQEQGEIFSDIEEYETQQAQVEKDENDLISASQQVDTKVPADTRLSNPDALSFKNMDLKGNDPELYSKLENVWFAEKDFGNLQASVMAAEIQDKIKQIAGTTKYDSEAIAIDKALQVYIDLQNNPQHASEYYEKLNERQKNVINNVSKLSKNPEFVKLAEEVKQLNNTLGLRAKERGVISNVLDSYVPRFWNLDPTQQTGVFRGGKKFATKTARAKQRTLGSIVEGWAKGYTLKVEGASNAMAEVHKDINRTIADKQLLELAKRIRTPEGNPIFSTTQLEGYKRVDHPNFTKWKWAGNVPTDESSVRQSKNMRLMEGFGVYLPGRTTPSHVARTEQEAADYASGRAQVDSVFADAEIKPAAAIFRNEPLFAPAEIANRLNKILGTSKLKGIPLVDAITKYNAQLKTMILSASLFHHQAFARSYLLGAPGAGINIRKAYKDGLESIKGMSPEIELLVRNGLTLDISRDWSEYRNFEAGKMAKIMDKIKPTAEFRNWMQNLMTRQQNFLFGEFGAGLKAKAAMLELRHLMKKNPTADINDLAAQAADLINDDFGGLHLERMGRDPTTQHIFRLFALAPDWTESNVWSLYKAFQGGNATKLFGRFWVGIALKGMTLTTLMNLALSAFDDKSFIERYKTAWEAGNLRVLDVDISPIYHALGGDKNKRKYWSLIGHFKDPVKWIMHPVRSVQHKGSVLTRTMHEALVGEDWRGRRFTTFDELFGMDDKGFYRTTRRGKYRKGEPKGGRLAGQLTAWGQGRTVNYDTLPSYLMHSLMQVSPIQAQNLIQFINGDMDGFDATMNSLGIGSRTYVEPEPEPRRRGRRR